MLTNECNLWPKQSEESFLKEKEQLISDLKNAMIPIVDAEDIKKGKTTAKLRKIRKNIRWFEKRLDKFKRDLIRNRNLYFLKKNISGH